MLELLTSAVAERHCYKKRDLSYPSPLQPLSPAVARDRLKVFVANRGNRKSSVPLIQILLLQIAYCRNQMPRASTENRWYPDLAPDKKKELPANIKKFDCL